MALTIPEREAVRILYNEKVRRGDTTGLQNFARVVLGAHAEQAKRLTTVADSLGNESEVDDLEFESEVESYTTNREGDSASYEGPIKDANQLMQVLGFDPEYYTIRKGGGSAWGQVGDQKLSIRAEFERKEYDVLRDIDRESVRRDMAEYAPEYPDWDLVKVPSAAPRLLEIMVADLHADKFGEHYSLDTAKQRFVGAIRQIAQAASYDGFAKAVLVLNGDTFNWDHNYKTTSGTEQDSIVPGPEVFRAVRQMLVEAIDGLVSIAPTKVVILPGNHDYEKSAYLADTLYSWYNKHDNVEVVIEPRNREYLRWGVNLVGFTHGKEERKTDLPMIMMRENDVRGVEIFEWHLGHIHTSKLEEHQGVQLRWFRTPAESGAWDNKKGYGHNIKEIVGIVWHRERGKIAEFPVQFL